MRANHRFQEQDHSARRVLGRDVAWLESGADTYASAALYGDLARLSDAELRRRGWSRDHSREIFVKIRAMKDHPADAAEQVHSHNSSGELTWHLLMRHLRNCLRRDRRCPGHGS